MDSFGELQVVKANIPMAEVVNYETELKLMTGGRGSYSIEFSHYDIVPSHLVQKTIAQEWIKELGKYSKSTWFWAVASYKMVSEFKAVKLSFNCWHNVIQFFL